MTNYIKDFVSQNTELMLDTLKELCHVQVMHGPREF